MSAKIKKRAYYLILTALLLVLTACGKKAENEPAIEPSTEDTSLSIEETSPASIPETETVSEETEEQEINY